MADEKKSVKPEEKRRSFDEFPLEVTPGKLMVPSSGHLDVKIRNTTSVKLNIVFVLESYSFDVDCVKMKDGKEFSEPFSWIISSNKVERRLPMGSPFPSDYEIVKEEGSRKFSADLESDHVLHLKITCEGKDEEIKNKLIFDKSYELGYLHIKCSYHTSSALPKPEDTDYASGFHLNSDRYFLLSIDPESKKAKELAEKFSEHQKQHARKNRVINLTLKEDKGWMSVALYEEDSYVDDPEKKKMVEKWNKEILSKYGPKLDQMSDDELRKIREGLSKTFDEARMAECKKMNEERQKQDKIAGEKYRNERKLKKKCMIM